MQFDISKMKNTKDMKISLENILPSLAKHLYGDDWRVTIRELLQNCHDAILEAESRNLITSPRIDIYPNHAENILIFKDNGIGMTAEEVEKYLATVGCGMKGNELKHFVDEGKEDRSILDRIIGQYGIGFLSSFIIAEQVQVLTRSQINRNQPGVRAIFTGETKWYHDEVSDCDLGTEVALFLKSEPIIDPVTGESFNVQDFLNFEILKEEVKRFGDLLPYPIYVHRSIDDKEGILCNVIKGPWEEDVPDRTQLEDFYLSRHPKENVPIHCFPFSLKSPEYPITAHGLIYFPRSGRAKNLASFFSSSVELWCRRMFIAQNVDQLLTVQMSFVGAIVECPDLCPTLSRNSIIQQDPNFVALRQAIIKKITEELQFLAERQARTFSEVLNEHRNHLYSSLLMDYKESPDGKEDFFRAIIEYIPFTVISRSNPVGRAMTMRMYRDEYSKKQKDDSDQRKETIYYLDSIEDMGQFKAMIIQRDIPVVLAIHSLETNLLQAYSSCFGDEVSIRDVREILDLYVDKVEKEPYELMIQFLSTMDEKDGLDSVEPARLEPSHVPAILYVQSAVDPKRADILQEILNQGGNVLQGRVKQVMEEEIRSAAEGKSVKTVILNDNNSVIRYIRDECSKNKKLSQKQFEVLHEIYHNARASRDTNFAETQHYFEQSNKLLLELMRQDDELSRLQKERDSLVLTVKQHKEREAPAHMEPIHCTLMLTDLRGSTRMVGFLDSQDSAGILQEYAGKVEDKIREHGGFVEKFTGDGMFASFGTNLSHEHPEITLQQACDCAYQIHGITQAFFERDKVAGVMLANNINIGTNRTVIHFGKVMYGQIAGSSALVGKTVIALFRACDNDSLFESSPIILSHPAQYALKQKHPPQSLAENVQLDKSLPPMTFYPHSAFASTNKKI